MIQTMMNVRSDVLLPASSPRLPVSEDFRWNVYTSSGCSSQQSQRSAPPSELLYAHEPYLALHKSNFDSAYLQKSRSRDHIDDRRDVQMTRVTRPSEHFGTVWYDLDAHRQPQYHHSDSHYQRKSTRTTPQKHDWLSARTGSDRPETTSGYHDDGGLDVEEEDEESVSPPKIAPVGGRILTAIDHPIVKPIPFRPVTVPVPSSSSSSSSSSGEPPGRKGSSQSSSLDRVAKAATCPGPDEGYASRDWQNLSSSSSVSQNSFPGADPGVDRKSTGESVSACRQRLGSSENPGSDDAGRAGAGSTCSRRRGLSFTRTPSPTDSGVGELEAMLREKEMELQALRETMERNETAMMQVFEERRRTWELEMEDVVQEWQLKLHGHQQRAFRSEQSLLLQIFKLKQENKTLRQGIGKDGDDLDGRTEMEALVLERDRLTMEVDVLKSQLKNAVEEASNRSIELISAQLVLKDSEIEIDCKNSEIHRLLTDLNQLKQQLNDINEQNLNLKCRLENFESVPASRSSSFDSLKVDLSVAQKDLEDLRTTLERERTQWLEEKSKVVNYQKHLQLNYIQMARKNKLLEIEVHQMTSELERHDAECQRVTMDESFC